MQMWPSNFLSVLQFIFEQLDKSMEREGVKNDDLFDWERITTDLSTATTTTSTTGLQYRSSPENKIQQSDGGTGSSGDDKNEKKKQDHVLQQNKLNKVEGSVSHFTPSLIYLLYS